MHNFDFAKIKYAFPRLSDSNKYIDQVIGFDTETMPDGSPFMFCTSTGDTYILSDIPQCLFTRQYRNKHFAVYNLKFDSGSILYNLTLEELNELRETNKVRSGGFKYNYIPHKCLRISKGKNAVTFWNISQYFNMSLENAGSKYLHIHKKPMRTKRFTRTVIKKLYNKIRAYCIQDAVMTAKLYEYMLVGLLKMNVRPSSLYSTASLAFTYFKSKGCIYNVWNFWKYHRDILQYACESYAGGKFEIYKRGRFNGVLYDINSAYPYEMSKFWDVSKAVVIKSSVFLKDSTYGFIRVLIDNSKMYSLPCPYKSGVLSIYPAGRYYATITKEEYEYLQSIKIPVRVLSGVYLYIYNKVPAYHSIVNELYDRKTYYKHRDKRQYQLVKIILNGFYGKMAQLIQLPNGTVKAGLAWNPIYAAMITANTRIRLSKVYQENSKNVLAVHTDSVIMNRPLSGETLGDKLGQWQEVTQGEGVTVACGIYQIADKYALRGFNPVKETNLIKLLKRMKNRSKITVEHLDVKSWTSSVFRGKKELTNRFMVEQKIFDVNSERKRAWSTKTYGSKLLNSIETSSPFMVIT